MNFIPSLLAAAIDITPPAGITLGTGESLTLANPLDSMGTYLPTIMSILGVGVFIAVVWWLFGLVRKATGKSK